MNREQIAEAYKKGERDFSGIDASGQNLCYLSLEGADLSSANLKGADLTGANLRSVNLMAANVEKADFSMADLSGASVPLAQLRAKAITDEATILTDLNASARAHAHAEAFLNPVWLETRRAQPDTTPKNAIVSRKIR